MRRLLLPRSATATTSAISITTHSHTTVTTRLATTFMRKSCSVVQKNGTVVPAEFDYFKPDFDDNDGDDDE